MNMISNSVGSLAIQNTYSSGYVSNTSAGGIIGYASNSDGMLVLYNLFSFNA